MISNEILEKIIQLATQEQIVSVFNSDLKAIIPGEEDAHSYELTNPPAYAIVTYVKYNETAVVGFFPNIDPRNPDEKTSNIAISPINLTHEQLVKTYDALLEIKPIEIVEISIVQLSKEQLATMLACEMDQDQLFNFIYANEAERNRCFDILTPVQIIRDVKDLNEETLNALLSEQNNLQSREPN